VRTRSRVGFYGLEVTAHQKSHWCLGTTPTRTEVALVPRHNTNAHRSRVGFPGTSPTRTTVALHSPPLHHLLALPCPPPFSSTFLSCFCFYFASPSFSLHFLLAFASLSHHFFLHSFLAFAFALLCFTFIFFFFISFSLALLCFAIIFFSSFFSLLLLLLCFASPSFFSSFFSCFCFCLILPSLAYRFSQPSPPTGPRDRGCKAGNVNHALLESRPATSDLTAQCSSLCALTARNHPARHARL
jgi:hypothetical protein